jgi:hypothetical protein
MSIHCEEKIPISNILWISEQQYIMDISFFFWYIYGNKFILSGHCGLFL